MTTFPSAPLLARCPAMSARQTADRLGVTSRTVFRWRAGGRLYLATADRVAGRLGRHLIEIWPDDWDVDGAGPS